MNETQKPVARRQDLVIQEMTDEVLVYDLQTNKAHCLNETAAAIWKSCDGVNTVADISRSIKGTNGDSAGEEMVWLAIDQLSEKNLLTAEVAPRFNGQTRREVIKKVGLAAVVALPIVTSLVAPTVASAGSICANPGCTCTLTAACGNAAGCPCNTTTGTNNCPAQCPAGCSQCTAANMAGATCTGTCS